MINVTISPTVVFTLSVVSVTIGTSRLTSHGERNRLGHGPIISCELIFAQSLSTISTAKLYSVGNPGFGMMKVT